MRAMLLRQTEPIENRPLELVEVPDPEPGPDELRIRVHTCAICRTDLHVIEGDLPPAKRPVIPGHQVVGTVEKFGPSTQPRRFHLGQRVGIAWLRGVCGVCRYCRSGRENLCLSPRFTGYHADGGYAELATVHQDFAYPIPEVFDDLQAAPLLCAGIIGFRALERSQLPPGGSLALYGFGSSAHVVIQLARARGSEVWVVTRAAKHRALALELGARWAGATSDELPEEVDSAILFAPAGELVPGALEKLARGGTLAIAGISLSDIPSLNYDRHLFQERTLQSVTANTRSDGHSLLAEAARVGVACHTQTFPLEAANEALCQLKHDGIEGSGVLVLSAP